MHFDGKKNLKYKVSFVRKDSQENRRVAIVDSITLEEIDIWVSRMAWTHPYLFGDRQTDFGEANCLLMKGMWKILSACLLVSLMESIILFFSQNVSL